jgi:hypothetical protein
MKQLHGDPKQRMPTSNLKCCHPASSASKQFQRHLLWATWQLQPAQTAQQAPLLSPKWSSSKVHLFECCSFVIFSSVTMCLSALLLPKSLRRRPKPSGRILVALHIMFPAALHSDFHALCLLHLPLRVVVRRMTSLPGSDDDDGSSTASQCTAALGDTHALLQ